MCSRGEAIGLVVRIYNTYVSTFVMFLLVLKVIFELVREALSLMTNRGVCMLGLE